MDTTLKDIISEINAAVQALAVATAKLTQFATECGENPLTLKDLAKELQTLHLD